MKKKLLASVLAGLGAIGTAHAVHVNPDGLGQVLLYPYFTVQGGFDSYVHVVNTTDRAKAVKVRFLEGKNSQEVLDFNLYLSPYDEWTGALVKSASGTKLITADTSCTAPAIPAGGVEFRNYEYVEDSVNGLDRTREGYIELIEMGDLVDGATLPGSTYSAEVAATHVDGVPADCSAIRSAANASGVLNTDVVGSYITGPTGGLYGFDTLISVEGGMATTIDAIALDDFFAGASEHTSPGSLLPSLENGVNTADILDGNALYAAWISDNAATENVDAVSAVLAKSAIMNDYNVAPGVAAMTDWVITFPTKRFYVNPSVATTTAAPYLFNEMWNRTTSTSCEPFTAAYYDREEGTQDVGDDDFSPAPVVPGLSLCNEVNTLSIVRSGESGASIFGAEFTNAEIELAAGFEEGWMRMFFSGDNALVGMPGTYLDGASVVEATVTGLPVIGFSATSFENGTLEVDGVNVLSNYLGSSVHKGEKAIYGGAVLP